MKFCSEIIARAMLAYPNLSEHEAVAQAILDENDWVVPDAYELGRVHQAVNTVVGPKIPLIGLVGAAGVGKDAIGEALAEFGIRRVALADPLKDLAAVIYGFDRALFDGPEKDEQVTPDKTPRDLLIDLAGLTKSLISDDVWVHAAVDRLMGLPMGTRGAVFTDVRHECEVDYVLRTNGLLVFVEREGFADPGGLPYDVEAIRPLCHLVVQNNSTPDVPAGQIMAKLAEGV